MSTRIDPVTVDEAIVISGMSNREMYAAGYEHCDAVREAALETLSLEVERLRAELAQKPAGSAWARLVDANPIPPVP